MQAVIISIGDEILNGTTINTNASWIANNIQPLGIKIVEIISIQDNHAHIFDTLNHYVDKIDLLFITGGLGPTKDDITKNVLVEFFHSNLVFHEEIYLKLKASFEKRNFVFTESNRSQAIYPDNCKLIKNSLGSAQGMWFTQGKSQIFAMPGVPFEMKGMMEKTIIPEILFSFELPQIMNIHIMTSGAGESWIAKEIEEIEDALPKNISLAYLPSPGIVKLRLTSYGNESALMKVELEKLAQLIKMKLGNVVFALQPISLEYYIGQLLLKLNGQLGIAESCTGGKISHKIVSVPGSSHYFQGSLVTYSYALKTHLLGVEKNTLESHGAVSEAVVAQMLQGTLHALFVDYAIAVSGIAGPEGGTIEKPVGTTIIGVCSKSEQRIKKYQFNKSRDTNIEYSAMYALHELRLLLEDELKKQDISINFAALQ